MNMIPKISVIIPNHNNARYLGNTLDSVLNQSFKHWEAIIVDDESTDESVRIIKSYAKKDRRFRLIQQKNGGSSAARNTGLDAARGDWIMFLDSDDFFHAHAMQSLLSTAERLDCDMAAGAAQVVPDSAEYQKPRNIPKYVSSNPLYCGIFMNRWKQLVFGMNENFKWMWVWRYIFKRELLQGKRFWEELHSIGDDILYSLEIFHNSKKFALIPDVIAYHRALANSACHTSPLNYVPRRFQWFPKFFEYFAENVAPHYSPEFVKLMYQNMAIYMLNETVIKSLQADLHQAEVAQVLREFLQSKYRFKKYLLLRHRIRIWMFIRAFGGGKK
jgi:glycosyltransferase involved in cell wall biosynthesis